jgi:uncharacterized protein (TIGR03083 family)
VEIDYAEFLRSQADELVAALRTGPLDAPVPACPGWDLARLGGHVGRVHRWAAEAVRSNTEPDAAAVTRPPRAPEEVAAYLEASAAEVLAALRSAADDPAPSYWTFLGRDAPLAFWWRRMAVETALHRWDAEEALGRTPAGFAPERAADAVEELLTWHAPARLAGRDGIDIGGSLHLHCTDTDGEWTLRTDDGVYQLTHGHSKGDAAVRGPASTLLLVLWRRLPLDAEGIEVFGDPDVARRFLGLGIQ